MGGLFVSDQHVHENVKNSVLNFIRSLFQESESFFVEPEYGVENKRIDIAFRNLAFIGEVEPSKVLAERAGKEQLKGYAKLALKMTQFPKTIGALFWAKDAEEGKKWDVDIYEYSFDSNGELIETSCGSGKDLLAKVVASLSKEPLQLTAENFLYLFLPIKANFFERIMQIYDNHEQDEKLNTTMKAYQNIMTIVCGESPNKNKIKEMFITHTIIQAIVNSILSYTFNDNFQGINSLTGKHKKFLISLPFLEWLYELYERRLLSEEEKQILSKLSNELRQRILTLKWDEKASDIFRLLYEEFLLPEDRRTFGEYYTPLWLVNFMFDEIGSVRDKVIVDSFCGSGTFLDEALRRKLAEGEEPEKAIKEVIGFDINPVAVMLARAELLLSYRTFSDSDEIISPLVFHANSMEAFTSSSEDAILFYRRTKGKRKPVFLYQVEELPKCIDFSKMIKINPEDISHLPAFESVLSFVMRKLEELIKKGNASQDAVRETIDHYLGKEPTIKFREALIDDRLFALIEKYGDGVWATSISSFFAVQLLKSGNSGNIDIDIAISNPPWIHLSEIKEDYGNGVRKLALKMLKDLSFKNQVINAGNIASVFLKGFVDKSRTTFFVLPASVTFDNTIHSPGKILTYKAIEGKPHRVYWIDYDAFEHGEKACLILVEPESAKREVVKINVQDSINKATRKASLEKQVFNIIFEDSIKRVLEYFEYTNDVDKLAKQLKVNKIYKQGNYIRGLFGGEKRKGKTQYAGLIIEELYNTPLPRIRLINTQEFITLYGEEDKYIKDVLYSSKVLPFYAKPFKALFSERGQEDLIAFLKELVRRATPDTKRKIQDLINEVQQGQSNFMDPEKWYVVYRCQRMFATAVLKGKENTIIDSHLTYLETLEEIKAYYYAATLNYLISKIEKGVIRNQFARPLFAILRAQLQWEEEEWQKEIAQFSKELHNKVEDAYKNISSNQVKAYIKRLDQFDEWKQLVKIFDCHVQNLEEALAVVSESKTGVVE